MRSGRLILSVLVAVGACAPRPQPSLSVAAVYDQATGCRVHIGDREVPLKDADQVRALLGNGHPQVHLVFDEHAPWKCVGALIYALHLAGVKKIGFVSEPPPSGPDR